MKRLLLLLLVPLLLVSCARTHRFELGEDGAYIDTRTDVRYTLLESCFEPAARGEEWGKYENKENDFVRTFYTVGTLDPALFIADDARCLYYAGGEALHPENLTVSAALFCLEDATSFERKRFTAAEHAAVIDEIRTLWFTGDGDAEKPLFEAPVLTRRVKLMFEEYAGIYYCFTFAVYESGEAYFYEIAERRTVAVPPTLADILQNE